jgi:hypothetical protein
MSVKKKKPNILLFFLIFSFLTGCQPTHFFFLCGRVHTLKKIVKDGLFMFEEGNSPYSTALFHQAPLLLGIFLAIKDNIWLIHALYILLDVLSAAMLSECARIWQTIRYAQLKKFQEDDPELSHIPPPSKSHPLLVALL